MRQECRPLRRRDWRALSRAFRAASNAIHGAIGHKKLSLPALGYIGEEIEGQLPEAYYDVHASQFLMFVLVVARLLPAIATYFCDTFFVVHAVRFAVHNLSPVAW